MMEKSRSSGLVLILFILPFSGSLYADTLPVRYKLELHIAADAITGLSDGSKIGTWSDLSIKDRDATQNTNSLKPIYKTNVLNGKPVVRFDGTDDYMSFTAINNIRTVFWVIKEDADAVANNRHVLGHSSQLDFHRGWPKALWSSTYAAGEVRYGETKINGTVVDGLTTDAPTQFSIISLKTTGDAQANQLTRDRGFTERVWDGDIAEIIIYSRELTNHEEMEVGTYLMEKYNISANYLSSEEDTYIQCDPGTAGSLFDSSSNPLVVTMDIQNMRQKIQNFGASDCWSVQHVGNWPSTKTNAIADLLFSTELDSSNDPKGIGLSLWRFNLGAGSSRQNNIYDSWRSADFFLNDTYTDYDWTRCPGQRNFLQLAKARGVEQFLAFANSPPITMTKNGYAFCDPSVGSTNLASDKIDDFADYMAAVVKHFRDVEGINFTYLSPTNEPQWDWNEDDPGHAGQEGCRYASSDIKQVIDELSIALVTEELDTEILICESGELQDLTRVRWYDLNYAYDFFNTASSSYFGSNNNVRGAISSHSYWSDYPGSLTSTRQSVKAALDNYQMKYAQTEYCILGDYGPGIDLGINPALWIARTIHYDLVVGGADSWQWWTAISPYDYKDGLVYCIKDEDDGNYYESKMLWGMGNFSRFVRPGMNRIELSRSDNKTHEETEEGLMVSGYYSKRHNVAVFVFINWTTNDKPVRVQINNLPDGANIDYMFPYITAGNNISQDSLTAYQLLYPNDTFHIPPRSVVTVVGLSANPADMEPDGDVDMNDLMLMAEHWLGTDCSDCGRTDINGDGKVNMFDFANMAENWFYGKD